MKVSSIALVLASIATETAAQSIVPEELVCSGNEPIESRFLRALQTDLQDSVDGGPFSFFHSPSDVCDLIDGPSLPWTFTLPKEGGCLIVEDCCVIGDRFEVRDFGTPIGNTSEPSGVLSVGEFYLRGGDHSIEIVTVEQCCGGLGAFAEITTDLGRCRDSDPYLPEVGDCDCALNTFFAYSAERRRLTPIGPIEEGDCIENAKSIGFTIGSLGDCSHDQIYIALFGPNASDWKDDRIEREAPYALDGSNGFHINGDSRPNGDYTLFAVVRGKPDTATMRKFEIKDSCTI